MSVDVPTAGAASATAATVDALPAACAGAASARNPPVAATAASTVATVFLNVRIHPPDVGVGTRAAPMGPASCAWGGTSVAGAAGRLLCDCYAYTMRRTLRQRSGVTALGGR